MAVTTPAAGALEDAAWGIAVGLMLNGVSGGSDYADTGWLVPTLAGGWTNSLLFRQIGHFVFASGGMANASFSGAQTNIGTLPVGIKPPAQHTVVIDAGGQTALTSRTVVVDTAGNIAVSASGTSSLNFWCSAIMYLTD